MFMRCLALSRREGSYSDSHSHSIMRWWMFDRSGAIGSTSFNIHQQSLDFLQVLTVGLSEMSETRPTIDMEPLEKEIPSDTPSLGRIVIK
ncbi:hypothetical protein BC936DRAFT_142841 [Jimgerdemannia flammicorona]|uniref:Uncharacterized protein n=2 Tax=Jimgerdemannia flammicorona TaxID=994334 RepID=A0A432ZZU5_9FUNG|nr:hypothetical protein BC936DRAFT_142841 [Jimgerdemannia flammicorona]RUS26287.1 hypothetical protein BC938DRAFT_470971 [Jimgerdemannia flammicorona]